MKYNYNYSLGEVLKDEGGYTNNPSDPGGPTNYGITIIDYRKYVKPNATAIDIKNMRVDEAKAIYKPKYWDAVDGDNLPDGIDYCVFDYGVNSGVARAKRIYEKYKSLEDPVKIINAICDERLGFLKNLKTWPEFGKGWSTRVSNVRTKAINLTHKKSTHTGPVVVTTGGAAVAAAHLWPHYFPFILAGLIAIGVGIYIYERYKHVKQN